MSNSMSPMLALPERKSVCYAPHGNLLNTANLMMASYTPVGKQPMYCVAAESGPTMLAERGRPAVMISSIWLDTAETCVPGCSETQGKQKGCVRKEERARVLASSAGYTVATASLTMRYGLGMRSFVHAPHHFDAG